MYYFIFQPSSMEVKKRWAKEITNLLQSQFNQVKGLHFSHSNVGFFVVLLLFLVIFSIQKVIIQPDFMKGSVVQSE